MSTSKKYKIFLRVATCICPFFVHLSGKLGAIFGYFINLIKLGKMFAVRFSSINGEFFFT